LLGWTLKRHLLQLLLISLVLCSIGVSQVRADIMEPPSGSCQFSQSVYSSGDAIVVYVYVTSSVMYQPVLVGNMPEGQVTISLGDKLSSGSYAFTLGTASPPSGYRDVVLEALGGYGQNYVEVARCGYSVQGIPLNVSVSANPKSGNVPLEVSFSSQVSGGVSPYSYRWSFGDGSSSSDQKPAHSYQKPGSYTATLTVIDNSGSQQSASVTVTVTYQPVSLEGFQFENKLPSCTNGSLDCIRALLGAGGIADTAVTGGAHVTLIPSDSVASARVDVTADYVTYGDRTLRHETIHYDLTRSGNEYTAEIHVATYWPVGAADWVNALMAVELMQSTSDKYSDIVSKLADFSFELGQIRVPLGIERIYTGVTVTSVSGQDIYGNPFNFPLNESLQLETSYQALIDALNNQGSWFAAQTGSPVALCLRYASGQEVGACNGTTVNYTQAGVYLGSPGFPQSILANVEAVGSQATIQIQGTGQGTYTLTTVFKLPGKSSVVNIVAQNASTSPNGLDNYAVDLKNGTVSKVNDWMNLFENYWTFPLVIVVGVAGLAIYLSRRRKRHSLSASKVPRPVR
jgi:PKD repeat protein